MERLRQSGCRFCKPVLRIIDELEPYWPISQRQIHYNLLNDPPLTHASKTDSHYRNEHNFSKKLSRLIDDAFFEGYIPEGSIDDLTRPIVEWKVCRDAGVFVKDQIENMLKGYYRDLLQSQPNHIEILVEKNTMRGIVGKVAAEYTLTCTYGRGYCSRPPREKMAKRFRDSGKEKLVLLILSDFDPSGEDIAKSFARSMRDDFGIENIIPVKVALTTKQVMELDLVPQMQAKESDTRTPGFVERHGSDVFELEAIPPAILENLLRTKIDSVIDIDAFNAELEAEKADAAEIQTKRNVLKRAIAGLDLRPE